MEKSKITLYGVLSDNFGKTDGNLEFKTVGDKGTKCLNCKLVETQTWGDGKEKRIFYPVSFMGKIAKEAEEQLGIGAKIKVEASYNTGKYTNAAGQTTYTHNFMVYKFEVLTAGTQKEESMQEELQVGIDGGYGDDLPF